MWDLPRPGLEPVSPALAGRFSTTAPPGKPKTFLSEVKLAGMLNSVLEIVIVIHKLDEKHYILN